jgi:hypothetical protein
MEKPGNNAWAVFGPRPQPAGPAQWPLRPRVPARYVRDTRGRAVTTTVATAWRGCHRHAGDSFAVGSSWRAQGRQRGGVRQGGGQRGSPCRAVDGEAAELKKI